MKIADDPVGWWNVVVTWTAFPIMHNALSKNTLSFFLYLRHQGAIQSINQMNQKQSSPWRITCCHWRPTLYSTADQQLGAINTSSNNAFVHVNRCVHWASSRVAMFNNIQPSSLRTISWYWILVQLSTMRWYWSIKDGSVQYFRQTASITYADNALSSWCGYQ